MRGIILPLAAAALLPGVLAAELRGSGLGLTEALAGQDSAGAQAVYSVGVLLDGDPLASLGAVPTYADCATACRLNGECTSFAFCGAEAGCQMPDNATLGFQECQLLTAAECKLVPAVEARGTAQGVNSLLMSGFPVRSEPPPAMPDLIATQAQGMDGGDFSCPGSVVEGACAFHDVLAAAFRCSSVLAGTCQSVVVYVNGTSGCQGTLLAVLKATKSLPDNTYWAPTVYILEKKNEAGTFIMYEEATLTPPDNETQLNELAVAPADSSLGTALAPASASPANSSAAPANAELAPGAKCIDGTTAWMGCVLVNVPAVMGGEVNQTIDNVASAESCCRACRQAGRAACNVFNWCPANSTCQFQDAISIIELQPQQCELRFQELVDPSNSIPPYLLAKGVGAGSFRAGAPVSAWAQPLPGYDRKIAGGLYGQPGTPCPDSLGPQYHECILSVPLPQLAERCSSDPLCSAVVAKPCGFLSINSLNVGMLRQEQGANASLMVRNPTTIVYFKQQLAASTSEGLSGGAVAGIATACVVVALATTAAAWLVWRRRRLARAAVLDAASSVEAASKALSSGTSAGTALEPSPFQSSLWPGSGMNRGILGSAPLGPVTSPLLQESVPELQRRGSSSGGSGSGPVLMSAVIGRPTAASPFASARARISPSPSAACSPAVSIDITGSDALPGAGAGHPAADKQPGSSSATASSEEVAGPQEEHALQRELSRVMEELIERREVEEAAASMPLSGGLSAADTSVSSTPSPASQHLERSALPASLQEWLIPLEEVRYLRRPNGELQVLGEGASGRVIRAELRGELVAAKEMDVGRTLELQRAFISEAQQLCNLRHANVVCFYGVCLDEGRGMLLTELCEGRDLGSVLQLENAPGQRVFGWYKHGCRVAFEVSKALNYLHSRNVAHMDIKSNNVLLTSRGMAKLGDVGLARMQTRTTLADLPQMVGTFAWIAPEVLLGSPCTLQVDLYSFGVLLWEIITGLRPVRGHMRSVHVPAECPQDAADLVAACCALDPEARPTARQLMKRLLAMLLKQREGHLRDFDC